MPDFFEVDAIVKSYDSAIVKRIFAYVRPYRGLLVAATLSLALATLGSLVLPVLVQRTVDEALMVSWVAVDASRSSDPRLADMSGGKTGPILAGRLFVRESQVARLSLAHTRDLVAEGILDQGPYYLTRVSAT
ncbi:MAG: hypothetical protein JXM71_00555, partial [Spirochaetales bacterium]|nr:hypothetical protein [Spirochaetales bacterium]